MSTQRILVGIDFSPHAAAVVATAAGLARATHAELTLLHVAAPDPDFVGLEVGPQNVRDERAHTLADEHRELHRMADELRAGGVEARAFLLPGATADRILEEARDRQVDWIVLGTHGRGALARAFVGSVSQSVLRSASCPVVVVPPARESAED